MAEVIKRGEFSQLPYRFTIAGDEPTVDEQMRIDQILRTEEFKFAKDYEEKYGRQLSGEGKGVLNYLGEFPKGVASGVVGGLESAALFATPYLPESVFGVPVRDPYREGVRSLAYGAKPLPDVGMEDTVSGKFGQALGSFVPLLATAVATKNPAAVSALSAAMGGGEATERAIAGGATVEQQRAAGLLGAGVGAIGAISPLRLSKAIGEPVTLAIIDRVRRAALEGGLEGATEVAETIAQNLIEQGIYNPEQGTFTETGEAFGYGAGVGAFVKGILDLAVPGKAPAAPSAVAPAAAPSAVAPAAPAEPKPTKPGVATISSVMRQGPRFGPATTTTVRLSDGEKITLKGDATEADIARAVDQYNKTKAAAEAPAAPKAPTPKTKVEDIPEAEIVQEAPRAAGGVSVDEDLAEARAVYDERLAIAEEGGADPEEAKRVAAQAAVNYVDSLQEDTRKRLERFRNTMARWATPTRGVMPPDLPDEAYSQEFGEPVQQDLFAAEPTAPTPAPAPEVVPAAVAPTPEVPPAPAPELTPAPATEPAAAKVEAPKAEAPKPAQVLTEETVDRLGIGKAKSARLRKLVGKPLTDTMVVQALSSWAQNDRATPENKALAVRLITGQPEQAAAPEPVATPEPPRVEVQGADWLKENVAFARELADRRGITGKIEDLFAEGLTAGQVRARLEKDGDLQGIDPTEQAGFVVSTRASLGIPSQMAEEGKVEFQNWLQSYKARKSAVTPAQEVADVPEIAAPQPEEVGAGVPGGGPSVEAVGQRLGDVQPAEGVEAPEPGGLGGDLPLPVDTAAAEGAERDTLTESDLPADPDKPSLPDTRGRGVRFHGSTSEISQVKDGYVGSDRNFYGQGFYTSDAVAITDGYSKAKGAKNGAVYRVDEIGPVNALDMEQPVPDWLIAEYEAGRSEDALNDDLVAAAVEDMQAEGKTLNLREFYDLIRDMSPEFNLPTYEVQEYFDSLSQIIVARGFNALDHIGGLRTKKTPHSVRIYLTPENTVRIAKVDPKNPDMTPSVEMPKAGAGAGAARAQPASLTQLEERLAAARARAAELRNKVPAVVLQRELVGGKVDPALAKQVANLQNVLAREQKAAESAQAKFDRTKVPGVTRDSRLRAYEAALAKVNETQTQLAAVQDQLAAAELSAGLRRAAEPKAPMTNKAQSAYTAYFNALQDADILRQTLETERARRTVAPEGPAPLPTDLREPVIPDTFMTYQRGITSKPVRPSKAPTVVAEAMQKERVTQRLTQFFEQRATPALRRYTTARGGINSPTTWKDFPDWMPLADQSKVVQLLGRLNRKEREKYKLTAAEAEPLSRDAEAAHTYFSKTIRPVDAIDMMLDDLSADYEIYEGSLRPGRTEIEHRDLMAGTGSEVATRALNWVRANLSPETNAEVDLILKKQADKDVVTADWIGVEGTDRVAKGREMRKEAREARAKAAEESGYDAASIIRKMAADDSRVALDQEMHYSVKAALNAGDLMGALRALADTTSNRELKDMASRFAGLVGTTRVRVLYPGDSAKYIGRDRGVFVQQRGANIDPDYENIILINGQTGMTNHVLMHEVAHALSARFIDENPNHPVVRQLQDLLTELRSVGPKQELYATGRGTARVAYPTNFYGLTDISELVAEGYGRLAFGEVDNGLRDLMKRTTLRQPVDEQVEIENPLNAWERFKEIIGNILNAIMRKPLTRRPRTKRIETVQRYETAAERFHRLVDGLLSEAPQVLPASVLQVAVIKPMIAKNLLNNAVLSGSTWSPAGRKRLADLMSAAVPEPLKRALLQLLQLEWFNDLAGKYFPQIAELKKLDDMRRGQRQRMVQEAQAVFDDLRDYAKKFPELFKTMSSLWGQATLAGVDPTELQSNYAGDKEKSDTWLNLNRQMTQADSSGQMQGLFRKVRNLKRFYRAEIERVLRVKAEEITGDKGKADTLVRMLLRKLDEENAIDPYFSLMRTGDFWLEYTAQDTTGAPVGVDLLGNELRHTARFVQAFKSPRDLSNFRAKLEAQKDANGNPIAWSFEEKIKPTVDRGRAGYIPPEFAQAGMNIINSFDRPDATGDEKAKIEAAKTAIEDLFLRLTPDHSFLKSFIKRKGTRGFVGDVTPLGVIDAPLDILTTLSEKTSAMSYQLTNMEFGARIQKLINSASVTEKNLQESPQLTLGEKAAARVYYAEFVDRAKFAKSPHVSKLSQATRGVTFGMTLGFNLAGALSNLATLPIVAVPEIAGRYGTSGALRELGFAMRTLANAGKTQKVLSFGAEDREVRAMSSVDNVGSLANYFEPGEDGNLVLRTDMKIPEALRDKIANMDVLAEVMANNGMLSASMSQEMLEAESGWVHKINRWSGFAMHHAERFNRQSVAVAVYNLELGNVKGTATRAQKLAAAMKAVETTDKVNGSIGAATAPPISKGPIGSVLFMYKRFGLHTTRYIINVALQSLKKIEPGMSEAEIVEAKKERAVARYQITGILGATALLAGVQGLPFFSELMSLLDLFFTDDDEEPPEVLVQKFLGEPYYHGALNYLLGIEVASRISMSGLIFRENKIEKDQSVYYDLIEMFGGPAVGVALNVERGYNLLAEGHVYRGVEALMPSVIKSAMKAGRYAVEDATTLRGDEVVELSAMDVLRQAVGYTPTAYARAQERASAAKRVDEAVDSKRRKLLKKYNTALRLGDFAEVREILKEMLAFTRKHPDAAITPYTLKRSATSFRKRSQEMISGTSFRDVPRAQRYIDDFDEDISFWGS